MFSQNVLVLPVPFNSWQSYNGTKCHHPTSWFSGVDPVRVDDAGDGEDVCSEEETSWYHGEFIHVGRHRFGLRVLRLCLTSLHKVDETFRSQRFPHVDPSCLSVMPRPAGSSPASEERLSGYMDYLILPHPGCIQGGKQERKFHRDLSLYT